MKKRVLAAAVILLLVLLLLAALFFTAEGHRVIRMLFPSANLNENLILLPGNSEEEPPAYTTSLSNELPGVYLLLSVRSHDLELSDEDLAAIRSLGVPMKLVLSEDGSAALTIFDLNLSLTCDADRMLLRFGPEVCSFFYQDGRLTLWEDGTRLIFEKEPDSVPAA